MLARVALICLMMGAAAALLAAGAAAPDYPATL
jgi:hypothetical protein